MFYSQFILAKKGPLGTIWIAAHLERKLRKNQVADTDIGVSVDSIIFPDVPIALRLSSHLLLGVVRIYSRKVNYLFDDCSEALLKIKQAFRSTAVDLPPEESTAPYHSITLPETFDLDDFELPDQELFQGNYVDHHISNKEQITLQDTMDGVVFSTSQFGLDERFGDGDTSQIGLDLDEDLLLNKFPAPEDARDRMDVNHDHYTSGHQVESVINDNNVEVIESAKLMQDELIGPEVAAVIPNISVDSGFTELLEYAQAPATPGLLEEPNLSNQKATASDDHFESEKHQLGIAVQENPTDTLHSSPLGKDMVVNRAHDAINPGENDHISDEQQVIWSIPNLEKPDVTLGEAFDLKTLSDQPCSETGDPQEKQSSLLCNGYQLDGQVITPHETSNSVIVRQAEESSPPRNELASNGSVSQTHEVLCPCNSSLRVHAGLSNSTVDSCCDLPSENPTFDKSVDMHGDGTKVQELQPIVLSGNFQDTDTTAQSVNEMNQSADSSRQEQTTHSELYNKTESSISNPCDEIPFPSPMSELPAPEKLLSMPEQHAEFSSDFLPDNTTPRNVLLATDEDGTGVNTGKKRSFTASTLTADSLPTVESSGKNRLGKTAESIPDDEDLLSSILVGRRSSVLKLKPTPTQTDAISMKRPRIASRNITYKRKVLMDEAMVLHGDTIREQLVSTEDIRRVRKKAPCTHQEIWMIQKQFLEEDIVYDPISSGMSMELVCIHNQAYELSGISITPIDESVLPTHVMQPPIGENVIPDTQDGVIEELNVESQLGTVYRETENQPGEGGTSCVGRDSVELEKVNSTASLPLAASPELPALISEMEVDGENFTVETAEHASSLPIESSSQAFVIPADNAEPTADCDNLLAEETNDCSKANNDLSSLNYSSKEVVSHSYGAAADGSCSLIGVDSQTPSESLSKELDNGERAHDIEFAELLTASETHDSETLDNDGDKEAGRSLSVDHDVNMEKLSPIGEQNEISYEFAERLRQANGTTDTDSAVVEDYIGMNCVGAEHDTGFLNVDDDDLEVDESYVPSVEENRTRIVDNSGWSSRSRAVGKYLQIMFDKEAEHGKNVIPVDKLLGGKSRKEASRMFFETLVLKTRDYIEVEQTSPFNNINLRPQSMLMKSDF